MSLVPRRAFRTVFDLPYLFEDFFEQSRGEDNLKFLSPKVDIKETDENLLLSFELPGLTEKDVKVELEDGTLTVEGSKQNQSDSEKEIENTKYISREIYKGHYRRSFKIGNQVSDQEVVAKMKNGILEIKLKKLAVKTKKEIPITA
jgi:HSP20 family protein